MRSRIRLAVIFGEIAVFPAQVAHLAGLRLAGVAGRSLAALVRVQVSSSTGAVAISRDRLLVDVVHYDSISIAFVNWRYDDLLKGPAPAGRP